MQTRGKILVIRGGAIGDFILTLPVLAALRESFPGAHIEVLGYPKVAQLASFGGFADEVRPIESQAMAGFFAAGGTLAQTLQDYFSSFQIIISYLYDTDQVFQTNVRRCSSAQFIQGPYRPDENDSIHATEVFLKPLERLAVFGANPIPSLSISDISLQNCIALHPGSGSESKNWPEPHWATLLQKLANDTQLSFLMIGGEAEGSKLERLQALLPSQRLEIARNLPLPDLARKLATCSFFVGHDSGITHLAAAVGVKGLVLWGPSKSQIWRPLSKGINLLEHPDGLPQLPVADVYAALQRELF